MAFPYTPSSPAPYPVELRLILKHRLFQGWRNKYKAKMGWPWWQGGLSWGLPLAPWHPRFPHMRMVRTLAQKNSEPLPLVETYHWHNGNKYVSIEIFVYEGWHWTRYGFALDAFCQGPYRATGITWGRWIGHERAPFPTPRDALWGAVQFLERKYPNSPKCLQWAQSLLALKQLSLFPLLE